MSYQTAMAFVLLLLGIMVLVVMLMWTKSEKYSSQEASQDMVLAWAHHLIYTRQVLLAFFTPGLEKYLDEWSKRLMENQVEIGNVVEKRFGQHAGLTVTKELTEHIQLATKVLAAVKAHDKAAQTTSLEQFYANAHRIGEYLDELYGTRIFVHEMEMHIKTLVDNVLAFVSGNAARDVATLDAYVNEGLGMAYRMASNEGCGCGDRCDCPRDECFCGEGCPCQK